MARVRLGALDPNDYAGRVEGAKARVEIGDTNGAVSELSTIASELSFTVPDSDARSTCAAALDAFRRRANTMNHK